MSLLAAHDQENLVHSLQAGAAVKGLNAGFKSTNKPPKTPFKVPLNDENAVNKGGKSALKAGGKATNAFVTPAGPRTVRAPLGMKTTNAKAQAFQTPAPLSASAKTQKLSPRLRRAKVKVHQPEVQAEEEDDVPEVEYVPPKEIPLPDDLDEDMPPINWDFPMFKGANMTRGVFSVYHNPVEDDGRTRGERELEESLAREKKKASEEFDKLFAEIMAKEDAEARRYLGIESPKKPAPKEQLPKKQQIPAPSTLKAKAAAAALSPAPRPRPTSAIPTAKSRLPTSLLASKKAPTKPTLNPSASRNAAAVAASKSTIGYAQGRAASSSIAPRKPLSNVSRPPPNVTVPKRPTTTSSRPTTASSIRSRSATTASTAVTAPRPRAPFSRSSSTSTNATLVASTQPEQEQELELETYRTAEDVEREMALLLLQEEDEEGDAAWMESFKVQLEGPDPVDEEYEGFQLQLPEGF
ncbi:uncharacterized protein EI97DRAFT_409088 [Westerdykella ornata]|uniref:Uncharacterized protein n=1 Tax=Westerdykella ornata TaxID=318751 RepID=A0A6A6JX69_WESOR|nr:uncharacterized protein EI97DRAFT_409088 [Westerdykella ornata]KAF2280825.1 hypothetical protein EI97DRAFT_409088 [Westerdykella ornata]